MHNLTELLEEEIHLLEPHIGEAREKTYCFKIILIVNLASYFVCRTYFEARLQSSDDVAGFPFCYQ